ncbi:MAG: copper chaperone PCu(A)C [Rhodospirillales bacterium]|nr:copper chaperone PCu(A)C [Rhodospirillales bacterium]
MRPSSFRSYKPALACLTPHVYRRAALLGIASLGSGAARAALPLRVSDAWFRFLLPDTPAAGDRTLRNPAGKAIVLTGVQSPACGTPRLHRTETSGGVDRMIAVSKVTVPAKGEYARSAI